MLILFPEANNMFRVNNKSNNSLNMFKVYNKNTRTMSFNFAMVPLLLTLNIFDRQIQYIQYIENFEQVQRGILYSET